jgi:hypothetical protein
MAPVPSLRTIRTAAAATIGHGALPLLDLVARLRADGLALGRDARDLVVEALDDDSAFRELDDERWVHLPTLLDGITWVTEVPAELAAVGDVPAEPDLALLASLAYDHPLALAGHDDGAVHADEHDDGTDVLAGPGGWLADVAGGLGAFRYAGEQLHVTPTDRPEPEPGVVAACIAAFAEHADADELPEDDGKVERVRTMQLDDLVAEAVVVARDAFVGAPVAPLVDVLRVAGLDTLHGTAFDASTPWRSVHRILRRTRLASMFDLDPNDVDAAELAITASFAMIDGDLPLDAFGRGEQTAAGALTGAPAAAFLIGLCLVRDQVVRAFLGEHRAADTEPEDLAAFANAVLDHLGSPEDVGVRAVLGWALDRAGDALAAEAALEPTARSGVDHAVALRLLAGFRADRGDAPGAMTLLRRIDSEAVERDAEVRLLVEEVEGYARHRPPPMAGRNDPCPCGSGRKYKVCHQGQERHALVDRGPWLYAKARRFTRDGPSRAAVIEVASTITAVAGGDHEMLLRLIDLPFTSDLVLHERGVMTEFVASRDSLLPDDEALTAARWVLTDRALFEVENLRADELALRDLRTGERIVVSNVEPAATTRPGSLFLGRPLPIGDTWRALSGFVPVATGMRDEVLATLDAEPDAEAMAVLIGRCLARPSCATATATRSCSTSSCTRCPITPSQPPRWTPTPRCRRRATASTCGHATSGLSPTRSWPTSRWTVTG